MATLSRSEVEHVAHLARLGLTDAELTRLEARAEPHPRPVRDPGRAGRPTTSRRPPRRSSSRTSCARTWSARPCRSMPSWPTRPRATATSSSSRPSSTSADRPWRRLAMTDPTRLHAHEMAGLLRDRRDLVARADRGAPGRRRARQPRPQCVAVDRSRAGPGRGRRRRHAAGDGHRRPRARARPAPAAARHPGRAQGPRVRGRRPVHGRLADPGRLPRSVRRAHHGASPRGGRGHPRQDQHGRVRDGLVDRELGLRPDGQPVGAGPRARRQQRRLGGGGGRVPRPAVDRHRHRRLDPPAGGPVRHRRDEADLRPGQPLRDRRLRQLARPDRPVRAGRPGRGGAAARRRRSRRPRLRPRRPSGCRRH